MRAKRGKSKACQQNVKMAALHPKELLEFSTLCAEGLLTQPIVVCVLKKLAHDGYNYYPTTMRFAIYPYEMSVAEALV